VGRPSTNAQGPRIWENEEEGKWGNEEEVRVVG
jgi:hypothetical protein